MSSENPPIIDPNKPDATEAPLSDLDPVILDAGATSGRSIELLKQGRGRLLDDIEAALSDIKEDHADQLRGRAVLPVIVVCRQRRRLRTSAAYPFMPFS